MMGDSSRAIPAVLCLPGLPVLWRIMMVCLVLPACQHQEPISMVAQPDPRITVAEPPAKALPLDLTVTSAAPFPMQSTPISVPTVVLEEHHPKLLSQPPTITTQTLAQPVEYAPKRHGLRAAFDEYLDQRNDAAIAALKEYPTDDQDIALMMLPLLARIDQGGNWLSLNGPQKLAFLESLRSLTKRLSKSAPLVLQNVMLVNSQPERYGEVGPRINTSFYPEEMVYTYAELINMVDAPNADGDYNVRLEVTLELQGANGATFWKGTKPFEKQGSISSRQDYHVTARFTLPHHLVPGSYQLIMSVLDRESNRTAKQTLPVQILEPRSKAAGKKR